MPTALWCCCKRRILLAAILKQTRKCHVLCVGAQQSGAITLLEPARGEPVRREPVRGPIRGEPEQGRVQVQGRGVRRGVKIRITLHI